MPEFPPTQAAWPGVSGGAVASEAQLPRLLATAHDAQAPHAEEEQHTPSVHLPDVHSLPALHAMPSGLMQAPSESAKQQKPYWQVPVEQLVSLVHAPPLGILQMFCSVQT